MHNFSQNIRLSRRVTLIAVMAAVLIVAKLSLAFVPNIEVVTTLVVAFGAVFGFYAVGATAIFCFADVVLYPTTPDVVIAYFIYWNLLSALSALLSAKGAKSLTAYLILALTMTIFFGILTSLTQSILTNVSFAKIYAAGLLFYALHLASTLACMTVAFERTVRQLKRLKQN